jgi:bacillithiol system protein YtxJ
MEWKEIKTEADLLALIKNSDTSLVLFKNSDRCSVSRMAKRTMEAEWNNNLPVYLINVIESRPVSNLLATISNVQHESPQLIVMRNGSCIYHASHHHIDAGTAMQLAAN